MNTEDASTFKLRLKAVFEECHLLIDTIDGDSGVIHVTFFPRPEIWNITLSRLRATCQRRGLNGFQIQPENKPNQPLDHVRIVWDKR